MFEYCLINDDPDNNSTTIINGAGSIDIDGSSSEIYVNTLNDLSGDGWEVVTVYKYFRDIYTLLKRPT